MSSDDTFCSTSGSSEQPFHSTPVKTKVEFKRSKILIENDNDFDNEASEKTSKSRESSTTTKSVTSSPLSSSFVRSNTLSDNSLADKPTNIPTSAWEQWLLKKEKRRRMQLQIELDEQRKQMKDEKHVTELKMRQKKASEEHYQKWLCTKKFELKKKAEEERSLHLKQELDSSLASHKAKLRTEMELKKWNERKLGEKKSRMKNEVENIKSSKEMEEHKHNCDSAFRRWVKDHQNYHRDRYSYGYAGGIVVSYYDGTSPPPPTFFNPDPWL